MIYLKSFIWQQRMCIFPCAITEEQVHAGLPLALPLKAAIGGVELLIDRAQLWEQSAAKHVSIAPHLEPLLAQARRWRKLELASWRSLLERAKRGHALGWFSSNSS